MAAAAATGGTMAAPPEPAKAAQTCDLWESGEATAAAAATVAAPAAAPCLLDPDQPFACELNRLFAVPECARFHGNAWLRLRLALHHFTERHAQACLDAGWSPREIYAIGMDALRNGEASSRALHLTFIGWRGAALLIGKREIIEITAGHIRFVADRMGSTQTLSKEHNPINHAPHKFGLIWEVPFF